MFAPSVTILVIFEGRNVHDLYLKNMPTLNLNMLLESPHANSCSVTTVMLVLSVTILKIFMIKMYLTLTYRIARVESKYVNHNPTCDFIFDVNNNVCSFSHHMQDLDLDL